MLKFFGRGAGFSDEHNGAYFEMGRKLILMDCPLVTFNKVKRKLEKYDEVEIAITHTHSDHIGGLTLLIHYATFAVKKKVTIIAPSEEVRKDIEYLVERLDGCAKETYTLMTADEFDGSWLKAVIPTVHVPNLSGRCFGYNIEVEGKNVVYTGDTATLEPYIPYLTEGSVLYTECSSYYTDVHIYVDDLLKYRSILEEKGIKVFLMHLDRPDEILKKTEGTGFELVPLEE